jgi:hypothetical protein
MSNLGHTDDLLGTAHDEMMLHPIAAFDTWRANWKSSDSQVGLAETHE